MEIVYGTHSVYNMQIDVTSASFLPDLSAGSISKIISRALQLGLGGVHER